jgi:hypothetical protein
MTVGFGVVSRVEVDRQFLDRLFALLRQVVRGAFSDRVYEVGQFHNWYNHAIASESLTRSQQLCHDVRLIPGFLEHLEGIPAIFYPTVSTFDRVFILITATGAYWAVAGSRQHLDLLIAKGRTTLRNLGTPSSPPSPTNVMDLDEPSDEEQEEEEEEEEDDDEGDDEEEYDTAETESSSDDESEET